MKTSSKNLNFKFTAYTYKFILAILILTSGCSKEITQDNLELTEVKSKIKTTTLEKQLKTVKKSAMRYHSFRQAEKNGYAEDLPFNPSPYVPNMGYHYTNVDLLDGIFDMEAPEILLYVPNEKGVLKLVGVEYAIPVSIAPTPPEGFIGEEDHWEYNPNVAGGAWTLHAWIVVENPNGVFSPTNPLVPFSDPSK